MSEAVTENHGPVSVTIEDGVAVVLVDSPPVNAMGKAVLEGLGEVAARLHKDESVRVVVLTGGGTKAFMAGADISEFEQLRAAPGGMEKHSAWAGGVLAAWADLPQPVIAAVQASAVGGGLEIALTADIILSEPTAKFGLPEVKLGLIPGGGGTQRLPRRIGAQVAMELMFLGSVIDAARAEQLGLVNRLSEPGSVVEDARAMARKIAGHPRIAVQALKRATHEDLSAALVTEREIFLEVTQSEDFREGFSAFVEKRAPQFSHR
ncbi:enoyl-CoA hydratase-related protein [Nocardioides sp. 616]|uniref:enoyl-CoA hydratase/isomerase family protein n=1 Tax=Nocardioides sp. 616 TaxID=2268090 RepID=UPI0013B388E9|nr:enoyl-CoA hydratase-related protein [Nocardioides sp. 616]